jgi:hypothetical protein
MTSQHLVKLLRTTGGQPDRILFGFLGPIGVRGVYHQPIPFLVSTLVNDFTLNP